ncbi:S-methyl-5-thioribose-1-phosphate isomerase [Nocardia camponoti]|uniref:Methylthioribose-1-phosphate isomerase n=1 Tax=Nocardia camponoti TaxID=1616106 RepID=A0A917QE42_9NOCA|nr:S-methyl-5-thioribose-1-phosphate isomerase [Nocardia camponoti]GGK45465.1 hypothetical protein GCM10011591_16300 [Nocardia camponoti]
MTDSSLTWDDGALVTIDQRGLPRHVTELRLTKVDQIIDAIVTLAIRGAPAIGIAGAFGVVIATRDHTVGGIVDVAAVNADADRIAAARPTAVNLAWAVERVRARVAEGADAVLAETLDMLAEDGAVNRAAATHAADLVQQLCGDRPLRLLTHCNTGRLATSAFGTAIGALRVLHERGVVADVLVDETRPLLQGARLTAWELAEAGIPHRLTIDSAAAWAMATGQVDAVLVGADRVTANGDVANKIGTFAVALAARHHNIPFIVVAPESTRDLSMATGAEIVVEQRAAGEVTGFGGVETAPVGTAVFNPAFDVTPADLVTAVVTENGVVYGGGPAVASNLVAPLGDSPVVHTATESHAAARRTAGAATGFGGVETAPVGTAVFNPAFDVTPADLVTAVVTENGVVYGGGPAVDSTLVAPLEDSPVAPATNDTAGPAQRTSDVAIGTRIADIARQLYGRGWMPGTAGNISVRDGDDAVVTASGLSKGELGEGDTVRVAIVDTVVRPGQTRKPSAETSIHTAIYRTTGAGAVVHVHSPFATALATAKVGATEKVVPLTIEGYELLKGFGLADPSAADIPVFPNWSDVARIGDDIDTYLRETPSAPPVLFIHAHGITAWGDTLAQARDRAECLEALCELVIRTGRTNSREIG